MVFQISRLHLEEFEEARFKAITPPRRREHGLAVCWLLPEEKEPIFIYAGKANSLFNERCYSHIKAACPLFNGDDARAIHCAGVVKVEFPEKAKKIQYTRRYCESKEDCEKCKMVNMVRMARKATRNVSEKE